MISNKLNNFLFYVKLKKKKNFFQAKKKQNIVTKKASENDRIEK